MGILEDKFYELIADEIINTGKKIYKRKFLTDKANEAIEKAFTRFDGSACVALDFKGLADYINNRMRLIYEIYTDPLVYFEDAEKTSWG